MIEIKKIKKNTALLIIIMLSLLKKNTDIKIALTYYFLFISTFNFLYL